MNTIIKEKFIQGAKEIILEIDDENSNFLLKAIIEKSNLNVNNEINETVYTLIGIDKNNVIIHKEIYFSLDKVLVQLENYIKKVENKLTARNKELKQVDLMIDKIFKGIRPFKKQEVRNKNYHKYHTLKNLQGEIVFVSDIKLDEQVSTFVILNQYLNG